MNTYISNKNIRVTIENFKELANIIKGLELLGKINIRIHPNGSYNLDLDTKYYHRFEESYINDLYVKLKNLSITDEFIFKNNRLYFVFKDKEIILPENICDLYEDSYQLTLLITFEQ